MLGLRARLVLCPSRPERVGRPHLGGPGATAGCVCRRGCRYDARRARGHPRSAARRGDRTAQSQARGPAVSVSLSPHSGSEVRGVASIRAAGTGTSVVLHVHGLHGGALAEAFLRKGACTRPGVRVLVLPKLKANRKGEATARGAIRSLAGRTVPYTKVTNGTYVLTIEPGRGVAACGEVAKDRSTTLPPAAGKGTGGNGDLSTSSVHAGSPSAEGDSRKRWLRVRRQVLVRRDPTRRARQLAVQPRPVAHPVPGHERHLLGLLCSGEQVRCDRRSPGPNCPGTSGKCTGYMIRTISPNAANVRPLNTCGPPPAGQPDGAGNGPCDLKYELKAILDREISAQNIDASKVFVTGSSAGGTATEDAICDPLISHYFRGAFLISANFFAGKKVSGTANLSNSPPLCPALTVPPINDDISVKYIHGTNDQAIVDNGHVDNWPDGTSSGTTASCRISSTSGTRHSAAPPTRRPPSAPRTPPTAATRSAHAGERTARPSSTRSAAATTAAPTRPASTASTAPTAASKAGRSSSRTSPTRTRSSGQSRPGPHVDPAQLAPSPAQLLADHHGLPAGCGADDGQTPSRICRLGDAAATKTVVVFGNSHIEMWMPPLLRLARTGHFALVPLIKQGLHATALGRRGGKAESSLWHRWALTELRMLKPKVTLVARSMRVSASPTPTRSLPWAGRPPQHVASRRQS